MIRTCLSWCVVVGILCGTVALSAPPPKAVTVPVSAVVQQADTPQLMVVSDGDRLTVRASIANKQRWIVAADQLILVAISKDGELISWQWPNPFICGPQPSPTPPAPTPGPGPGPQPTPVPPIPTPDPPKPVPLWITIVHESAHRTPAQAEAWASKEVLDAIAAAGHKLRLIDQDAKDEKGQVPPHLATYLARAKAMGIPFMVAMTASNVPVWEGSAPQTKADMLAWIKQRGGK